MAINKWVVTTFNAGTGASQGSQGGLASGSNADGGSVVVGWDSAVITTFDQLRTALRSIDQQIRGQLPGAGS
jgi:hypothetical protein